jgi:hypothetical protein
MTDATALPGEISPDFSRTRARLSRGEWAFLIAVPLVVALVAMALGKDGDWDFENYHWYNAYAFLHHRLGFDVAVAHQPTYYNPFEEVPFYWLATHVGSWLAVCAIGLVEGLNVVPLFFIARAALAPGVPHRRILSVGLALAGMCGATAVSMIGRASYDNVLSALALGGIAVLLSGPKRMGLVFLAGFLFGAAAGLKLVEMFYCVGFAAAVLVIPGNLKDRTKCIAAGAAGGVAGFVLLYGYWARVMWHTMGNPFFPYFNSIFNSPLILQGDYRNTQFLPQTIAQAIGFPFFYLRNFAQADDVPFRDLFFIFAYVAIPLAAIFWALGRAARDSLITREAARILFVFVAVSYAAWLAVFAVHRYIVGLEMLSPILIVAAIGLLPLARNTRVSAAAAAIVLALLGGMYHFGVRAPLGDPYVQLIDPPRIPHPDSTMILMTGLMPLAYLIPELPPQIPVLRVSSYMTDADDHALLTARMRARSDAHQGDMYFLVSEFEFDWAVNDAKRFGLALDPAACQKFSTNLGGPYRLCEVTHAQAAPR